MTNSKFLLIISMFLLNTSLSDKHSIANLVSHKKDFEKKEVEKDAKSSAD